jgi:hypothetical protein
MAPPDRRWFDHLRVRRRHADLVPRQFRRDGAIFIHVPKCAGSALLDAWLGFQTGHVTAAEYHAADPLFFDRAYVFAFVRDPVDRFVSAYDHIQTGDLWPILPEIRAAVDRHGGTLEAVAAGLTADSAVLQLPWFAPQHTFLEICGRLAVNRVFKTESFAADIEILRSQTPIRLRPLAPVNRRGTEKLRIEERLSPAAVAALRRVYWRDFTLFGYY